MEKKEKKKGNKWVVFSLLGVLLLMVYFLFFRKKKDTVTDSSETKTQSEPKKEYIGSFKQFLAFKGMGEIADLNLSEGLNFERLDIYSYKFSFSKKMLDYSYEVTCSEIDNFNIILLDKASDYFSFKLGRGTVERPFVINVKVTEK